MKLKECFINLSLILYALVLLCLMSVGFLLPLPGYDGRALWADEFWRVLLILNPDIFMDYTRTPNVNTAITSPLYVIINRFISLFFVNVIMLRLSFFIPVILSISLVFLLIKHIGWSFNYSILAALFFCVNFSFI